MHNFCLSGIPLVVFLTIFFSYLNSSLLAYCCQQGCLLHVHTLLLYDSVWRNVAITLGGYTVHVSTYKTILSEQQGQRLLQ